MKSSMLVVLMLALAGGCASIDNDRLYVDPSHGTTRYEDLVKPDRPLLLKISVEQTFNGRPYPPDPQGRTRARVVRVLQDSGFVRSSNAGEDGSIELTLNDASPRSLREGSGPGWHAREVSELTVVISTGGRTVTKNYEHAILRYRGAAREAEGLTKRVGRGDAVHTIVEQMLLQALLELQREGVIQAGKRT